MRAPFKRIKLTGDLSSEMRLERKSAGSCAGLDLVESQIRNQASGGKCALNSVLNASDILGVVIPDEVIETLRFDPITLKPDPMKPLEEIVRKLLPYLNFVRVRLNEDPLLQKPLIQLLNEKDSGFFIVESVGHNVCWDASKRLLYESDPCLPVPVLCSRLQDLGIKRVDLAYQVLLKRVSNKRKKNKFKALSNKRERCN